MAGKSGSTNKGSKAASKGKAAGGKKSRGGGSGGGSSALLFLLILVLAGSCAGGVWVLHDMYAPDVMSHISFMKDRGGIVFPHDAFLDRVACAGSVAGAIVSIALTAWCTPLGASGRKPRTAVANAPSGMALLPTSTLKFGNKEVDFSATVVEVAVVPGQVETGADGTQLGAAGDLSDPDGEFVVDIQFKTLGEELDLKASLKPVISDVELRLTCNEFVDVTSVEHVTRGERWFTEDKYGTAYELSMSSLLPNSVVVHDRFRMRLRYLREALAKTPKPAALVANVRLVFHDNTTGEDVEWSHDLAINFGPALQGIKIPKASGGGGGVKKRNTAK